MLNGRHRSKKHLFTANAATLGAAMFVVAMALATKQMGPCFMLLFFGLHAVDLLKVEMLQQKIWQSPTTTKLGP